MSTMVGQAESGGVDQPDWNLNHHDIFGGDLLGTDPAFNFGMDEFGMSLL